MAIDDDGNDIDSDTPYYTAHEAQESKRDNKPETDEIYQKAPLATQLVIRQLKVLHQKVDRLTEATVRGSERHRNTKKQLTDNEEAIGNLDKRTQHYKKVEAIVFGGVAFVLLAVLGALVGSVIIKPGPSVPSHTHTPAGTSQPAPKPKQGPTQ